jgi:hypothetical protein
MKPEVGAELEIEITAPTELEFHIAVAPHPNTEVSERLSFVLDGKPVQPLEISGVHGNRIHKVDAPVGNLLVDHAATIIGQTNPAQVTEYDLSMYLRPSRYAEADKFYAFAATEFANYVDSTTLSEKVSSWVGTRLSYVPGSSDPIDGAVDTCSPVKGRRGILRGALPSGRRDTLGAAADGRGRRWCASPPDAMPPTPPSWTTTRVRSH